MKKLFLLLFCILLLVPLVSAIPPFETESFEVISEGLEIRYPLIRFIEEKSTTTFSFHVYNATSGYPLTNETISCYFHLYNSTGNHIHDEEVTTFDHSFDFEMEISGSNLTQGEYFYVFQCNNSKIGGFTAENFRVTSDGEDDTKTDTSPGVSATIFLLFVTTLLFIFPFLKDFSKHKWANNIIKRAFWTVGIFVLMWNASILATIADNANLDIVSHLFRYMIMFGWAGYVAAAYLVLKSLFEMIATYKIHREKKRFGDKNDGI